MTKTKAKTATKKAKAPDTIQSKGGKAVLKKYGKDYFKNLVLKRHNNAKKMKETKA